MQQKGVTAMRQGLEQLLAKGQDNALLRFGLGNACFKDGDYGLAAEHLQKAVEHNPQYSAAWKLLGKALLETGDTAQAQAVWQQGMQSAEANGDSQTVKEIAVFLKRLAKAQQTPAA
ncbi:MAG: tetratricopeptide repeat protein [Comamonas sp.]